MRQPGALLLEGPDGGFPAARHATVNRGRGQDDPLGKGSADRTIRTRGGHGVMHLELGPTVGTMIVVGGHEGPP